MQCYLAVQCTDYVRLEVVSFARFYCVRKGARTRALLSIAATACVILAGCGSDGATAASSATYVANLSGSSEVPRVTTTATGTATFGRDGSKIEYTVIASGFVTPLTVGHIHIGAAGVTGPVIVPFTIVAQSGTVASGSIDLSVLVTQGNITITGDSLRSLFDSGNAYVNLHTAAYPGGEIRGQIVKQ